MNRIGKLMILVQLISMAADASSAFMATNGTKVLTGRNADSDNLNIIMHVLPPSEGKYG